MRTIGSSLENTITEPSYRLEISPSGSDFTLETDAGDDFIVSAINPDRNTASIKLGNTDLGMGTKALNGSLTDASIDIYKEYTDTSVLLVSGYFDELQISERWVDVNVVPHSSGLTFSPRIKFNDFLFSYLPADGTVIRWGNEEFTVENNG